MIYIMSDLHGCKELFLQMLRGIKFDEERDKIIIAGDVIEKGRDSIALLECISKMRGVTCILGNHELDLLKEARHLTRDRGALDRLRLRFSDGHLLTWELIDYIETWQLYYEEENFLVVHAGVPLDSGFPLLDESSPEQIVNDRRFRNAEYRGKTVFFGHTETPNKRIVGFLRRGVKHPERLSDYSKIWLDCGAWHTGTLGAFCTDNLRCYYVEGEKKA